MRYTSTRNSNIRVSSADAITKGLSDEGGLFVPESIPEISMEEIAKLGKLSYPERAHLILRKFLTDFTDEELRGAVTSAYGDNFTVENAVQLSQLYPDCYILELFHGPTCAFKDMALQLLPHLMTISARKSHTVKGKDIAVLCATSGDTGKAALEGFRDVPNTSVTVFYPEDGVSDMQKRQMITQEGANVRVCAVKGNFDDCQTGVKEIFTDTELTARLAEKNMVFSSANSINWGRLVPQIVYYISAYSSLLDACEIEAGERINICVPTGNFGNILAAYYAKEMGLPVNKLICASNSNNILTDFIKTGVYDRNRDFHTTMSPSMDILLSSNLERLEYQCHLNKNPDRKPCTRLVGWYDAESKNSRHKIPIKVLDKIKRRFYGGWCSENDTAKTIREVFNRFNYLFDPHTAVAYKVYQDYKKDTGDNTKTVIASTASPYKFCSAVYLALGGTPDDNEYITAQKLAKLTNTSIPEPLLRTESLPVRFTDSVEKNAMKQAVADIIESL
jgi:threonine synthase